MGNPQANIKELESKLGKYNNSLDGIKDFNPLDYYNYIEDNFNYFASTGADPSIYYARKVFKDKVTNSGGEYNDEYAKRLSMDQLIGAIDSVGRANNPELKESVDPELEDDETVLEANEGIQVPDTTSVNTFQVTPLVPIQKDRYAGQELLWKKPSFEEAYPQYEFLRNSNLTEGAKATGNGSEVFSGILNNYSAYQLGQSHVPTNTGGFVPKIFQNQHHFANGEYYANAGDARMTLANQIEDLTGGTTKASAWLEGKYGTSDPTLLSLDLSDLDLRVVAANSELDWSSLRPTQETVDYINKKGGQKVTLEYLRELKRKYDEAKAVEAAAQKEANLEAQREQFRKLPAFQQDAIMRDYATALEEYNHNTITPEEISFLTERLNIEMASGEANTADVYKYSNEILDNILRGTYTIKVPLEDGTVEERAVRFNPSIYVREFDKIASGLSTYYADNYLGREGIGDKRFSESDKLKLMTEFMAINSLQGSEAAIEYLGSKLPKYEYKQVDLPWWADVLTLGVYTDSGWGHSMRKLGKNVYSTLTFLGGAIEGTGRGIIDLLGGDTPEYMKDLGFFERWGAHIGTSYLSQHAYNAQTYGVLDWHAAYEDAIRYNVDVTTDTGKHSGFWNFMGDTGFSTAATILSLGTSALAKWGSKGVGKLTSKMVAKKVMNETVAKGINKTAGVINTVGAAMAVGAPEAIGNALDVYNSIILQGSKDLERRVSDRVDYDFSFKEGFKGSLDIESIKEGFNNPEVYDFLSQHSSVFQEMDTFSKFLDSEEFIEGYRKGQYSEEWVNLQYEKYLSKLEKEIEGVKSRWGEETYKEFKAESEHAIETQAWQSFAGAAALDLLIVSTTDLFFSKALAPSLGRLADVTGIPGLNRMGKLVRTTVNAGGDVAVNTTKYGFVPRFAMDVISEGLEEVGTYAVDESAKALAMLDLNSYYYNSGKSEAEEAMGSGLWQNLSAVASVYGDSFFSDEGWHCFSQGALGALVGSAHVSTNTRANIEADLSRATNRWERISAVAGNVWRSPIFYHTTDRRQHIINSNKAVEVVRDHLQKDEKFAKALQSSEAAMSYIDGYFEALVNADTVGMEENEFGMYVAQANVLAKLKGTSLGKAFEKRLKELQDLTIDSELGQQIADRYIELLDIEDKTDYIENKSLALEEAKKNITKFVEIQKSTTELMEQIDKEYGYAVDDRTKEAIAYTHMSQEKKQEMLQTREEMIAEALTKKSIMKDKTPTSNLTDEQKAAVAHYGTYENAVAELAKLKAQGAHSFLIREAKNAVKALSEFKDGKTPTLNIREILALTPKERAEFFRGNVKYSAEQKKVIDTFKASGLGRHVQTAIEEAGKIQEKLDLNESILESLEDSALNIFRLQNMLETNALIANAKSKAGHLNEATTYEDFRNALDALIESGKLLPEESAILGTFVLTDNRAKEFYKKYNREIAVTNGNKMILSKMTLNISNKKTKAIVMEVLDRLSDKMRSESDRCKFSDAEELFKDGGFIETLKSKYKIDWNFVSRKEQHRVLSEVKKGIDAFNKALSNREDVVSRFNSKQASQPTRRKKGKYDIFNRDVYESAKDVYNSIFEKVVRIFNGEKITLTPTEVYQLACLFDGNILTAPIDTDSVVLKGIHSKINSIEDLNTIIQVVDSRLSIYEDTYDTFAQFSDGLRRWKAMCTAKVSPLEVIGSAIAELNPSLKDRLDTSKKEGSKENRRGINFKDGTRGTSLSIIPMGSPKLSEAHSRWYEEHNIPENIKYLLDNKQRKDIKLILVKDSSLYEAETTYDNDNLPMAVAVVVPKGTKNSVEVDGLNVIYVGIAGESRQGVSERVNILNAIRDNLLANSNDSESWVIRYDDTNNPIEFGGWNYEYRREQGEVIPNLRERLLTKYSHLEESKREEAAYEDFCENTVKVNCAYEEENGSLVFKISYTWNGEDYTDKFNVTEEKVAELTESGRTEAKFQMIGYIEPNQASNQPLCNLITYNFYDASYLGNNLIEIYEKVKNGEINILDPSLKDSPFALIHEALAACEKEIFESKFKDKLKRGITSKNAKDVKSVTDFIEKKINGIFSGFLNLQKPKGQAARVRFETSVSKDSNGVNVLNLYIKDTYTGKDLYNTRISIDELFAKNSNERQMFLQDILFNTILKSDGNGGYSYRVYTDDNGKVIPIIKMQVNYKMFNGTKGSTVDKRKAIFQSGVLKTDASWAARRVESISATQISDKKGKTTTEQQKDGSEKEVVDNNPTVLTPTEAVQRALDILANFKHKGLTSVNEARSTGASGVTTFINDGKKDGLTKEQLIATEIGTSLDFVVRKYLELGKDANATFNFIKDTYSSHTLKGQRVSPIQGLDWGMLKAFIENIKTLTDSIEARGEMIVPFDLIFREIVESESGKFANLTAIPDIVTIDKRGQLHIYDMKSYLATGVSIGTYKGMNAGTEIKVARGAFFDANIGQGGKWQQQVSLYAHIIKKATGLEVASVGIIPIPVRYKTAGVNVTDTKIEAMGLTPVRSLTNADGNQFKLERIPSFAADAIRMEILKLSDIESSMWVEKTLDAELIEEGNESSVITAGEDTQGGQQASEEPIVTIVEKIEEEPSGDDDFGDLGGTGRFRRRKGGKERRNPDGMNPKALKIFKCL